MNINQSIVGCSRYKNQFQFYSTGDLINFEGVTYNDKGHYLPELNRFLCNTTGVYYITVNYYHGYSVLGSLYLGVTLNTLTVLHSSRLYEGAEDNTLSNSRLLRCQQNDTLMVRATGQGFVYGYKPLPLTTFSAMLIHNKGKN